MTMPSRPDTALHPLPGTKSAPDNKPNRRHLLSKQKLLWLQYQGVKGLDWKQNLIQDPVQALRITFTESNPNGNGAGRGMYQDGILCSLIVTTMIIIMITMITIITIIRQLEASLPQEEFFELEST